MSRRERVPTIRFKTADHFRGPLNYGSAGAAALDLRLPCNIVLWPGDTLKVRTGLFLDMTDFPNMAALLLPRSGLGTRGLEIANTVGLIDSDYQGEIIVALRNANVWDDGTTYHSESPQVFDLVEGDRFVQMLFVPVLTPAMELVDQFPSLTARGEGGFGSTGTS